eukprot:3845941-Rhodomonas_salina.1
MPLLLSEVEGFIFHSSMLTDTVVIRRIFEFIGSEISSPQSHLNKISSINLKLGTTASSCSALGRSTP